MYVRFRSAQSAVVRAWLGFSCLVERCWYNVAPLGIAVLETDSQINLGNCQLI